MLLSKKIFCIFFCLFLSVITINAFEELFLLHETFEEENVYLIIKEASKTSNKDIKLMSLAYIEDSINRRNTNIQGIYDILKFLAVEGTVIPVNIENMINDFPEVRFEAVKLLMKFNNIETRKVFFEILKFENHQLILQEAIKYLTLNWPDIYKSKEEIDFIIYALEKIKKIDE